MSLLSTIRYPISMPPTRAQLEALPYDIFIQWLEECGMGNRSQHPSPGLMAEVLHKCDADSVRPTIERLQCIIYGLDE